MLVADRADVDELADRSANRIGVETCGQRRDHGLVDPTWSIEEYTATYDDDDKEFVGTIEGATGLFTPNLDGPNPKRKNNANNYGDVWVVASYQQPGMAAAKALKARAHLLVTVPLYIKWDQPEVGR